MNNAWVLMGSIIRYIKSKLLIYPYNNTKIVTLSFIVVT